MSNSINYIDLLSISKPPRYSGNEINSIHKKEIEGKLHFAFVFPDIYEIGMSHLGFKLLYDIMNRADNIYCERFFVPPKDADAQLGERLYVSYESKTPLRDFDVIGITIPYELSYSSILHTLRRSGLPLRTKDRLNAKEDYPLVIAGGSCCNNPAVLSSFIDAFCIGEGDDIIVDFLTVINDMQKSGKDKQSILEYLNSLPYFYVPSVDEHKQVKRHIYAGFSSDTGMQNLIVPNIQATQDKISIEVSRGCTRMCRFCQAGMIYRPARERSVSSIIDTAGRLLDCSGYNDLSLLSLSAADYTDLQNLLTEINANFLDRNVSVALPSVRADMITEGIFVELSKVKASGFTIAPEAGSQRMRDIINKSLTEEEIFRAVKLAYEAKWRSVKLYFMIGLPGETLEDVEAIADLAIRMRQYAPNKGFGITVSVSNFVPKPFTPFQWVAQDTFDSLLQKKKIISEKLRNSRQNINFRSHRVELSIVEAVLSRGDKLVGDVLASMVEDGYYLDAWEEHFNYELYKEKFIQFGSSLEHYAGKNFELDEPLYWDNISVGVTKEYLVKEFERAKELYKTSDCKISNCHGCGICDFKTIKNSYAKDYEYERVKQKSIDNNIDKSSEPEYFKYTLVFKREEYGTLLSALDLSRILIHALRIAKINFRYTQGFSPSPHLSYTLPLPVGIGGTRELVLFSSERVADDEKGRSELIARINEVMPIGITVTEILDGHIVTNHDMILGYSVSSDVLDLIHQDPIYIRKHESKPDKTVSYKDFIVSENGNNVEVLYTNLNGGFNFAEYLRYHNKTELIGGVVRTNLRNK